MRFAKKTMILILKRLDIWHCAQLKGVKEKCLLGVNPIFIFTFLSNGVVSSVKTSLYPFFLVFVCQELASNAQKVRSVVLLSRNRFPAPVVENLEKSHNVIFLWKFFTVSLILLSIFHQFMFSYLSHVSASYNSIFTDCSVFDRFCLYLHSPLYERYLRYFLGRKCQDEAQ